MSSETTLYRTSDIYFSAYLCSLDIEMIASENEEKEGQKKLVFVFKVPKADLGRLKASFFGGSGTVKVRKFVDSLKALKSLCYI
jgi:hypothetical protein